MARVFWLWQPKWRTVGIARRVEKVSAGLSVFPQAALDVLLVKYIAVLSAWASEIITLLKASTSRLPCCKPGLFPKLIPADNGISNLYGFVVL